jgi:hypothetical protein
MVYDLIVRVMEVLAYAFIFVIGMLMLNVVMLYVLDVTQTKQAVRRIGTVKYAVCDAAG